MLAIHSYRKAIIHIDGDAFFASCEIARRPDLKGKAVVTGEERGIVTSLTYEAKRLGVKRCMKVHEVRTLFPQVIVLSSDYQMYALYSIRMYDIVRRYTSDVEEYSIDECYADITGLRTVFRMSYKEIAEKIKHDLETELGISFSIGLAPSKTLAKLASKWKKPSGLTAIPAKEAHLFLKEMPVSRICGVGPNTEALFFKMGIKTALDLAEKSSEWVNDNLSKPFKEIWTELRGESVVPVKVGVHHQYKSIMRAHTFRATNDKEFIFAEISKHVESLCARLRSYDVGTKALSISLKTQEFHYINQDIVLSRPTAIPQDILAILRPLFDSMWKQKILYRATSLTLFQLMSLGTRQEDLFGQTLTSEKLYDVYEQVDKVAKKFGRGSIFLGSSFQVVAPSNVPENRLKHKRILGIPHLGEVI